MIVPLAVEWTHDADKDVGRLDRKVKQRIRRAVNLYATTGQGDVVRMKAPEPGYRLRVGEWRVRFDVDRERRVMTVFGVFVRGDAYKRR